MRKITFLIIVSILILNACTQTKTAENSDIIRVGIFDTNGDSPGCIADAYEALRIDSEIKPEVISAATIMSEEILDYDLILFPGGSGKAETSRLGDFGQERIKELVFEHGKSVIGICAGAYILTQTEGYPSLDLSGMQATDIEHDHRGHGIVKFSLTEKGTKIYPELADRELSYMQYYEGPVLIPVENANYQANSLATMLSDVHTVEGTPSNMTNNKPFIITSIVGNGNTASFVGHPETTPGMRWMIPRMVRYLLNKELVAYSDAVIRPKIYKNEILFTDDLLSEQSRYYDNLWGTEEEKIEAINGLVEISAWSAKKKIVGLLRDSSPEVRKEAANALVQLERTDFIYDLEIAVLTEKDEEARSYLKEKLNQLQRIIHQ
ncbi:MAG: HEAT repeat domain-containing protein [Bacteroidales bacterium]|nr:HEAT repeat domain-containing protein [Bacteroidales bacterium]